MVRVMLYGQWGRSACMIQPGRRAFYESRFIRSRLWAHKVVERIRRHVGDIRRRHKKAGLEGGQLQWIALHELFDARVVHDPHDLDEVFGRTRRLEIVLGPADIAELGRIAVLAGLAVGVALAVDRGGGRLRPPEVALHHVVAADRDLARLSRGRLGPVAGDDLDLDAPHRQAHRARPPE